MSQFYHWKLDLNTKILRSIACSYVIAKKRCNSANRDMIGLANDIPRIVHLSDIDIASTLGHGIYLYVPFISPK